MSRSNVRAYKGSDRFAVIRTFRYDHNPRTHYYHRTTVLSPSGVTSMFSVRRRRPSDGSSLFHRR